MQKVWVLLLALLAGVLVLIGMSGTGTKKPPEVAKPAPAPIQTRQTLKKTTQNVLELSEAVAQGGVRADLSIKSQGLEVASEAYRTSVGKLSIIAVDQKMNFFQAENDRKPKDYKEFMDRIIEPGKPDGIMLPMLPYYQEYAYDPEAKELVVIEFPAKKEQRQKETTSAIGL
ncbi:MAG: hypothetical protein ACKOWG_04670 [Planctomycetia bacterium]